MDQKRKTGADNKNINIWKENKVLKWIKRKSLEMAIFNSLLSLIKTCLSSNSFQSFIHFFAAVLAGALTIQVENDNFKIRWGFLIPFVIIYLILIILFNIMNKRKVKQVDDKTLENSLLESVNKSVHELSVMRHSLFSKSNPDIVDIVAQNTCKAVYQIICDYFSTDSIKVTTIKRCSDTNKVKMNGLYPGEGQTPTLYDIPLSIKGKHNPRAMSFIKIFRDNKEEGVLLKTEEEVMKELAPHDSYPIHTKQLISIPGFVNNRVVILLQISAKEKDLFSEQDFLTIAEKITPVFVQILTNTHMIDNKSAKHK